MFIYMYTIYKISFYGLKLYVSTYKKKTILMNTENYFSVNKYINFLM